MAHAFSTWIQSTSLSWFVKHYPWVWPACETLHFIALCFLFGVIALVDLRLVGLLKKVPFGPLHKLIPWAIGAFAINTITGIMFFAGDPFQYVDNISFQLKMVFMALAGINVFVFYFTFYKQTEHLEAGQDTPFGAKIVGATSLFLWIGVMYFGRMLPYIGNAF